MIGRAATTAVVAVVAAVGWAVYELVNLIPERWFLRPPRKDS